MESWQYPLAWATYLVAGAGLGGCSGWHSLVCLGWLATGCWGAMPLSHSRRGRWQIIQVIWRQQC